MAAALPYDWPPDLVEIFKKSPALQGLFLLFSAEVRLEQSGLIVSNLLATAARGGSLV